MCPTRDAGRANAVALCARVWLPAAAISLLARGTLVFGLVLARVALASGDDIDLMQTLIAEDATLNNNLAPIEPRWQRNSEGRTLEVGFNVEKMLSPRLDVEIAGQWDRQSPRDGPAVGAFGNLDLELKYVFLELADFRFAVVPQLSFPTSSHIGGEAMHVQGGGRLTWGGRLGSGVEEHGWPGFLRAVEFQGDLGYSHTFGSGGDDELVFDPVVDYSLPYLTRAAGVQIPWPLNNLCVFTELNGSQPLGHGTLSLFATPGLAYLTDTYQVTAGVQLPLTRGAEKNAQTAVLGSVLIFMDQLDPRFGWMPF